MTLHRDAGLTREELERPPTASAIRDLRATLHHLLQVVAGIHLAC